MEKYRGQVAFSFDPPDAFWTSEDAFEKFVLSCFKEQGVEDEDLSVYKGCGFELADHRDTADSYERADSVEDFVNDNLDLSTTEEAFITDAYILEDEERLVVTIAADEADVFELKHWEVSPYETMKLERIDANEDGETYDFIYHIGGLNRTNVNEYNECKMNKKLFDSILRESYADDAVATIAGEKTKVDFSSVSDAVNAGKAAVNAIYDAMGADAPNDLDTVDCFFDDADCLDEDEMRDYWTDNDVNAAVSNIRISIDDVETKQFANKIDKAVMYIISEEGL